MTAVELSNALTARWAARQEGSTVFSGAVVYPLLAHLATVAEGAAREELLAVAPEPLELPVRAAIGVWVSEQLEPKGAVLALTDQAAVDAWAREQTDGRIPAMPALIDEDTLMLLASALSVRTRWREPFVAGPLLWEGRRAEGLRRAGTDAARVLDGPVTVVSVEGDNDVTVELALGEGPAHEALIALLRGGPGAPLAEGAPGVTLAPSPQVSVPRFAVNAAHNLLAHADLFGLVAAQDKTRGHFPGLSDFPLAVDAAAQVITASFGAEGFESDAITAIALVAGGPPPEPEHLAVSFDRPFAFAVRLRSTKLVLLAGCVTEP